MVVDKSGCIATEVSVFVRNSGGAGAQPQIPLGLRILQVNECKEQALLNISTQFGSAPGAFSVAPDLSIARLDTSVLVRDKQSGEQLTATIRLSWRANEKAIVGFRSDEPVAFGKLIRRKTPVQRKMRMAKASGVVSVGSANLVLHPTEAAAWIALDAGGTPLRAQAE
jgi:hypothetical protein